MSHTTPDNRRKILLIFGGFLLPAAIFLLFAKYSWVCKALVVLPAVLCYICGTLLMLLPCRDNIKMIIHESAAAAIYLLSLCYSFSVLHFLMIPEETRNDLEAFLGVYLDFMIWSFVFILIGYRIHYRRNRMGIKNNSGNNGKSWNIATASAVTGSLLFLKLFGGSQKYAVARAIIFACLMLTFLMLSVGIFEFRRTQFYYKSNQKK